MRYDRWIGWIVASAGIMACAGGNQPTTTPSPAPATINPGAPAGSQTTTTIGSTPNTTPRTGNAPGAASTPMVATTWRTSSHEHIDLWLHTYAMLDADTMLVPYFTRGYRTRMTDLRRQRGVSSLLDQTRDKLVARIAVNPSLSTSGQFIPLYFPNWETMRQAIDVFVRGSARASTPTEEMYLSVLASAFPAAADRDWLRQFADAADDESRRFYHDYWTNETRIHAAVTAHLDSVWQRQWRPTLQRYLNNTQQQNGELYLSLPLGGEGRTVQVSKGESVIAVPAPATNAELDNVLYVVAHEVTGAAASAAISDNTTPAERRSGTTSRFEQAAAVRAGALLLEKTLPNAVPGYMRYYLQQAGRTAPTDPKAAFMSAFAIPDAVRDAIVRQLEVILGGI
jgi:hypothetical protein